MFRGLKKSNSETKLGDRLGFGRRSKSGVKSVQASPLPPRPNRGVGRILENIATDTNVPSLHSPRHDTDQFGNNMASNIYTPLIIQGRQDQMTQLSWNDTHSDAIVDEKIGRCPVCRQDYDSGPRRMLVDSCGHERCYGCMLRMDAGCEQCRLRPRHQRPSTVNIDDSTMSGMSLPSPTSSCITTASVTY